jgi:hypothetical protein
MAADDDEKRGTARAHTIRRLAPVGRRRAALCLTGSGGGRKRAGRYRLRPPRDMKVFGLALSLLGFVYLCIVLAYRIGLTSYSGPTPPVGTLFGLVWLEDPFWVDVNAAIYGLALVLGGTGLAFGRRWAWWVCLLCLMDTIPTCVANIGMGWGLGPTERGDDAFIWLALVLCGIAWLLVRARVYDVFGMRLSARGVPPSATSRPQS